MKTLDPEVMLFGVPIVGDAPLKFTRACNRMQRRAGTPRKAPNRAAPVADGLLGPGSSSRAA